MNQALVNYHDNVLANLQTRGYNGPLTDDDLRTLAENYKAGSRTDVCATTIIVNRRMATITGRKL